MHVLDADIGSLSISFIPSIGYTPNHNISSIFVSEAHEEEPPRNMGEGYVMMRSTGVNVKAYYDQPGCHCLDNFILYSVFKFDVF